MLNKILGTWSLKSWVNIREDGSTIYPFGKAASGYISYSRDGHVFVHIMGAQRAQFSTNDPFDATDTEHGEAGRSHISYSGRFQLSGSNISHYVDISSCPNWVGSEQLREVTFQDDDLILSAADARLQGRVVRAVLNWSKT